MSSLALVTPPASEPVTLAEVKAHLRLEHTADDTYLAALISAAREKVENDTRRAIIDQTWRYKFDVFSDEMELPKPPLKTVSAVKYIDTSGVEQTLDSSTYAVDTDSEPGVIRRAYGKVWPATRNIDNAVSITFTAGFSTVPEGLKHLIKFIVAHWYENREPVVMGATPNELPQAVESLIWQFRVFGFPACL